MGVLPALILLSRYLRLVAAWAAGSSTFHCHSLCCPDHGCRTAESPYVSPARGTAPQTLHVPAIALCKTNRLQAYIPAEQLSHVKRVLYGANQGKPVSALDLPKSVQEAAAAGDFDLQAYKFMAAAEQFRAPRIVRIGLIQHAIVKPTTAPLAEQRQVGATRYSSVDRVAAAFADLHDLSALSPGAVSQLNTQTQTERLFLFCFGYSTVIIVASCRLSMIV